MEFAKKWCLNDIPVPLVHRHIDCWNINKVVPDMEDEENKPFYVLNMKGTMRAHWLEKNLKLPWGWWRKHISEVPLMNEISETIAQSKRSKNKTKTLEDIVAARSNVVVVIKIRELDLFVVNDSRSVVIALREDNIENEFLQFYEELKKDIEALVSNTEQELHKAQGKRKWESTANEELEGIISESTEILKRHVSCTSVCFNPSRGCLKVNGKFFHVPNFNKRFAKAITEGDANSWEALKVEVLKSVALAVAHLDSSSSTSLPLSQEQPLVQEQKESDDEDEK